MLRLFYFSVLCLVLSSCAELMQLVSQETGLKVIPVSNTENIAGLKSSLNIGIENAVGNLGVQDGFFKNTALKLLLPKEAQPIIENIKLIQGGQNLLDKAILSLNRSAEDAVKEATPIFKKAILNMSITDGLGILFGGSNAATEFLRKNTYSQLQTAFNPVVRKSLGKPLLAGISTNDTWNNLSAGYNSVATTQLGKIAGLKSVNVSLENHVTEKALDALFIKVAEEENNIRANPLARVNELLKRVFGQLDKK